MTDGRNDDSDCQVNENIASRSPADAGKKREGLFTALILAGLVLSSLFGYLVFHTLAETFSIVIAFSMLIMVWNTRQYHKDQYLLFLGLAISASAFLDLIHMISYKGMGVFPGIDANVPTQLWIAARSIQSVSLLAAPIFFRKRADFRIFVAVFALAVAAALVSIFVLPVFPDCYHEGQGLTSFKIAAEYAICLVLALSMVHFVRKSSNIDRRMRSDLLWATALTILSELAFTFYVSVYGLSNFVGHLAKLLAFSFMYRAILDTGFKRPVDIFVRDLAIAREELETILDSSPTWIFYKDCENRFIRVNAAFARLMGKDKSELVNRSLFDFYPRAIAQAYWEDDLAVVKNRKPKTDIVETLQIAGQTIPVQTDKVPYLDRAGNVVGVVGFSRDISGRIAIESRMSEINQELESRVLERTAELERYTMELESLAYSLSHDMRSPLRAMEGFSSILLRDYGDRLDDSGIHALTRIQTAARHMGEVIGGLLELSRISRVSMTMTDVDLSAIARHLTSDLQAKEPDRECVFTIEPGLSVRGDARLLELMLAELIENAWKFTAGCAPASIRFWRTIDKGEPAFHISDNGAGFDMAFKDKLFKQFERLHGEKEFPGTGLGLVTAHRIVMRHRGRIWAESAPGMGAIFTFTLADP